MKAYLKMEPHLRRIKKEREKRDGDEKKLFNIPQKIGSLELKEGL